MNIKKYRVMEGKRILADNMELQYALLFIKALCEEFFNEPANYTLKEIEVKEGNFCE